MYASILFKALGICFLTQFSSDACRDAGEGGIAHKAELCLTLYTYLTCGHSLLRTCDKLFTHRNTVQYRIRKIREEFGLDTEDPDRQLGFLLSLALALLRLGHEELFIAGSV